MNWEIKKETRESDSAGESAAAISLKFTEIFFLY